MGIFIKLSLVSCTFLLFINCCSALTASSTSWMTADNRPGIRTRRTKSVHRPIPIDCRLGRWSSWTPCNSCTDKKFRFRYLEKPSQFGGTDCTDTLWDTLACPTATSQCLVPDYCGDSFTCKESGRCIDQTLRCNGESDCEDFSDEDDCESLNRREDKCSTLLPIPGAEHGTQGYNVLTGDFTNRLIDSNYFGGKCEYVYNGEWRKFIYDSFCESLHYNDDEKNYRKPYNYHTYHFVAEATSEGSHEYYDDVVSLMVARKKMKSKNSGGTVGIYYVEVGLTQSRESEFLLNLTQYKSQELGFVRLWSKVQTARFKMRSDKLVLDEDFYLSLLDLPEQYDFGMYSRFFNTFGTHYVTEGTMGGTLEYVVVVNKRVLAESKLEGKEAGRCFGASIGISYPMDSGTTIDLNVGRNRCKKPGSLSHENTGSSVVIEDIVSQVRGGIVDSSLGLVVIRNPETYRKWGASLKYNPTVIEHETMPIYELVRLSTAADHVGDRLAHLKRAFDEYLQHFDSCRCAPCRHNGIAVLSGTSCKCICKQGYEGEACEETVRGATKTDGSWSCWGAWTTCASGRKFRTRTCDNPSPDGGGANCVGSSAHTQRCS